MNAPLVTLCIAPEQLGSLCSEDRISRKTLEHLRPRPLNALLDHLRGITQHPQAQAGQSRCLPALPGAPIATSSQPHITPCMAAVMSSMQGPDAASAATHILVSNDDGIEAPGIKALVQALAEAGYSVHVVAPRSEQSAKSQALTLAIPHVIEELPDAHPQAATSLAVHGTPADSVMVALASGLVQVLDHCSDSVAWLDLRVNPMENPWHARTLNL